MADKDSGLNRRQFLRSSVSLAMAGGIAGLTPQLAVAQEDKKEQQQDEGKIIYRKLGKTGFTIPVVSLGVGASNNPAIVQAAFEKGIRFFDTAANYQYGRNEQMVGNVLHKMGVRDKAMIGTKILVRPQRENVGAAELKKRTVQLADGSLKRLKSDFVELMYVHDLNSAEEVKNPAVLEAMQNLKSLGKAKAIGITTHSNMAEVINAAVEFGGYEVILTAINFTLSDDSALMEAIHKAASAGIGIVAMKTQAGGANWPNPESRRNYSTATMNRAALKWVLNNPEIATAIPGMASFDHLEEDFQVAYNLGYSEDERNLLTDNSIKLSMEFCRQCNQCLASCPNDVDIPTLMRTHMYARQYSDFYLARHTLDQIPAKKSLPICNDCDTCYAQCANSVNIAAKIDELKTLYV